MDLEKKIIQTQQQQTLNLSQTAIDLMNMQYSRIDSNRHLIVDTT
jgi:hypothetical protein